MGNFKNIRIMKETVGVVGESLEGCVRQCFGTSFVTKTAGGMYVSAVLPGGNMAKVSRPVHLFAVVAPKGLIKTKMSADKIMDLAAQPGVQLVIACVPPPVFLLSGNAEQVTVTMFVPTEHVADYAERDVDIALFAQYRF